MLPNERKLLSYVLVRLQPGASAATVQALIMQSTGLRAYTGADFSNSSRAYFIQNTGVIMNVGLSAVMAFLIGGGIAGMTFYTSCSTTSATSPCSAPWARVTPP